MLTILFDWTRRNRLRSENKKSPIAGSGFPWLIGKRLAYLQHQVAIAAPYQQEQDVAVGRHFRELLE